MEKGEDLPWTGRITKDTFIFPLIFCDYMLIFTVQILLLSYMYLAVPSLCKAFVTLTKIPERGPLGRRKVYFGSQFWGWHLMSGTSAKGELLGEPGNRQRPGGTFCLYSVCDLSLETLMN